MEIGVKISEKIIVNISQEIKCSSSGSSRESLRSSGIFDRIGQILERVVEQLSSSGEYDTEGDRLFSDDNTDFKGIELREIVSEKTTYEEAEEIAISTKKKIIENKIWNEKELLTSLKSIRRAAEMGIHEVCSIIYISAEKFEKLPEEIEEEVVLLFRRHEVVVIKEYRSAFKWLCIEKLGRGSIESLSLFYQELLVDNDEMVAAQALENYFELNSHDKEIALESIKTLHECIKWNLYNAINIGKGILKANELVPEDLQKWVKKVIEENYKLDVRDRNLYFGTEETTELEERLANLKNSIYQLDEF